MHTFQRSAHAWTELARLDHVCSEERRDTHIGDNMPMPVLQDGNITDLRDSYEDLAYEANAATAVPSHINLLRPVALLFRDAAHTQLAGIVYPRMEGKDLHSMIS